MNVGMLFGSSRGETETETYELGDGRDVPVVVSWRRRDYSARVLRVDDGDHDDVAGEWLLTWTDGVNEWLEEYELPWLALARLAALVAAAEQDVFLVHDPSNRGNRDGVAFHNIATNFIARTVHAFNCPPICDGMSGEHAFVE